MGCLGSTLRPHHPRRYVPPNRPVNYLLGSELPPLPPDSYDWMNLNRLLMYERQVIYLHGENFFYIRRRHPVCRELLRKNPDCRFVKVDGEYWTKVTKRIFRILMFKLLVRMSHWTAVQRAFRRQLQRRRQLAIMMAIVPRLSAESPLGLLEENLLKYIASTVEGVQFEKSVFFLAQKTNDFFPA